MIFTIDLLHMDFVFPIYVHIKKNCRLHEWKICVFEMFLKCVFEIPGHLSLCIPL
jgi:hypothetical protein